MPTTTAHRTNTRMPTTQSVHRRPPGRRGSGTTFSHRSLFLRKWLRDREGIASVTPSSSWMCDELTRYVRPDRPQHILELGAGTGVVTRRILARMHPDSALVIVEVDPDFAAMLERTYADDAPRVRVLAQGFETVGDLLPDGTSFDVVVSGMPTPNFPPRLLASLRRLMARHATDAWLSQLTEIPVVFLGLYRRMFREVEFRFVPLNMPPGGVYHCRGVRSGGAGTRRRRGPRRAGLAP